MHFTLNENIPFLTLYYKIGIQIEILCTKKEFQVNIHSKNKNYKQFQINIYLINDSLSLFTLSSQVGFTIQTFQLNKDQIKLFTRIFTVEHCDHTLK